MLWACQESGDRGDASPLGHPSNRAALRLRPARPSGSVPIDIGHTALSGRCAPLRFSLHRRLRRERAMTTTTMDDWRERDREIWRQPDGGIRRQPDDEIWHEPDEDREMLALTGVAVAAVVTIGALALATLTLLVPALLIGA